MRSASGSVLIVSAEPQLGEGLRRALQRNGMASILVSQPAEAVLRLAQDAPSAILVDMQFTEMDPEQVVHRALACRETHGSPVVALGDDPEARDRLLEGGCTAVLSRATPPQEVAQQVSNFVRTRTERSL